MKILATSLDDISGKWDSSTILSCLIAKKKVYNDIGKWTDKFRKILSVENSYCDLFVIWFLI